MSIWSDTELKSLRAELNELKARVAELEKRPAAAPTEAAIPMQFIDKRSKAYREWKNANS
jgi:hypothetical protein